MNIGGFSPRKSSLNASTRKSSKKKPSIVVDVDEEPIQPTAATKNYNVGY